MVLSYLKSRRFLLLLLSIYFGCVALNAAGIEVWLPVCPIYQVSGIECIGCGLNRAFIDLVRFRYIEAWHHNPLVFFYIPIVVYFIAKDFYKCFLKYKNSNQLNEYGKI